MRTTRPTTRRRAAALAVAATGAGAALLLAGPAHAAPAPPQLLPIDAGSGLIGATRGVIPPIGTPDMSDHPGADQLPGLEIVPLPSAGADEARRSGPASGSASDTASGTGTASAPGPRRAPPRGDARARR